MAHELRWFLIKNVKDLAELDAHADHWLDTSHVPSREAYAVRLALEELLTNVIKYTRQEPYSDLVHVCLTARSDCIVISIVYEGPYFDPRDAPEPGTLTRDPDQAVAGLGLVLVRKMVSELEYERIFGLNRVDVRINIPPVEH